MAKLSRGKIPIRVLNSTVLRLTGAPSDRVVTPARAGVDFAAVKLDKGFLIASADPITGVAEDIGYYALKVSANDVATSGAKPEFAESVVLLPEGASERDLRRIARQMDRAARESGITIVGGHTEVTPGLRRPMVVVTAFAFARRFVTSAGARDGDVILMTKTAGLEGTSEIARVYGGDLSLPGVTLAKARRLIDQLDITAEASAAFRTGAVHAMHDCTEGGVLGAAFEMSVASGVGFELDESKVPVADETRAICGKLSVDPLRLIGSGSLLIAVPEVETVKVERSVGRVCKVTRVGRFTRSGRALVRLDGARQAVKEAPVDELWRLLGPGRRLDRG